MRGYFSTHLVFYAFVVFNILAEVHSWRPDVVLTVQAAAGLLQVFMFGNCNLIPGEEQKRRRVRRLWVVRRAHFFHIEN